MFSKKLADEAHNKIEELIKKIEEEGCHPQMIALPCYYWAHYHFYYENEVWNVYVIGSDVVEEIKVIK